MEDRIAWKKFQKTGRVEDYLTYAAVHKRCIESIGDTLLRQCQGLSEERPENRLPF